MTKEWYPKIDASKCQDDCFACLKFCPKSVFEKDDKRPIVSNPDNCVDKCEGCKSVCPVDAITFLTTKTIIINGVEVGIIGLDEISKFENFEDAFKFIKEHNYIPEDALEDYRMAIDEHFNKS